MKTFYKISCAVLVALLAACGSKETRGGDDAESSAQTKAEHLYLTSTVVLGEDAEETYVTPLFDLDTQTLDLHKAREFGGWAGVRVQSGKLFVSDGEASKQTRFSIDDDGTFHAEGSVGFGDYISAYASSVFVSAKKAYMFADEIAVWNPTSLQITGSFASPKIKSREGGMEFSGLSADRQVVVRGNRTFVATSWANWDDYTMTEDSLIIVIDNEKDEVVGMLPVNCPYLDVATQDDDGNVYFSNWVYSIGQTLLQGKHKACAVRVRAGEETIDEDWSLTFADVTDGREAAALRYVGDGRAVMSVYYDDQLKIEDDSTPATIADESHWRFWTIDLDTFQAGPIEDIDFNGGGAAVARVDERAFLMVPGSEYARTTVYEVQPDGSAEKRWETKGWSTDLFKLR